MQKLMYSLFVVAALLLSCGEAPVDVTDISGIWAGELSVAGLILELRATFTVSDDEILSGTLDIPQQQARGLELTDMDRSGDSLTFSLPSNLGQGNFRGLLTGDTLSGEYEQGGYAGSFLLVRVEDLPEDLVVAGEEVLLTGDDCILAGTLTIPGDEPPYPCVILLSGSGLQDRDEYVMGFSIFAQLADILDSSGFAVLRCDDRGIGGSSGGMENFSDSVLLYDAGLMLDHMLGDPRIKPGSIGLLGHSEGSNIAFMLAAQRPDEVAFVVSMAGPAVDGYVLIPSQLEVMLSMQGFSQEEIESKLQAQYMIMDAVIDGGDPSVVDSILRSQIVVELRKLTQEEQASLGDFDAYVEQTVNASVESVWTPWFRNFLTHDPADIIDQLNIPVLCLLGELDTQVLPGVNIGPMEEALVNNPDHSIVVFENANHLFQEALTGSVAEYAVLEPAFVEGFEDTLTAWLEIRFVD